MDIADLAVHASFPEVCYLLSYGELPTRPEREEFRRRLTRHSLVHEDMKKFFEGFPPSAHPMIILSTMIASLSAYYPEDETQEQIDLNIIRLLAKAKTLAAFSKYVDLTKSKDADFKLMGFGHRVYKNFDPRARILKQAADEVLAKLGLDDPLLEIAKRLEEVALADSYFIERKLYPNVDFYSGILRSSSPRARRSTSLADPVSQPFEWRSGLSIDPSAVAVLERPEGGWPPERRVLAKPSPDGLWTCSEGPRPAE